MSDHNHLVRAPSLTPARSGFAVGTWLGLAYLAGWALAPAILGASVAGMALFYMIPALLLVGLARVRGLRVERPVPARAAAAFAGGAVLYVVVWLALVGVVPWAEALFSAINLAFVSVVTASLTRHTATAGIVGAVYQGLALGGLALFVSMFA